MFIEIGIVLLLINIFVLARKIHKIKESFSFSSSTVQPDSASDYGKIYTSTKNDGFGSVKIGDIQFAWGRF